MYTENQSNTCTNVAFNYMYMRVLASAYTFVHTNTYLLVVECIFVVDIHTYIYTNIPTYGRIFVCLHITETKNYPFFTLGNFTTL